MDILDSMKDIVKYTHSLGIMEMVKVIGTATDAKIETKDADNTVIVYGSMYQPITGIDSTVGLSRLAILKGFIGMHDKSKVSIKTENRQGVDVPTDIVFNNGAGFISNYRFMSEQMVNDHIKVPPFKGATWDVTFSPEKASIALLSESFSILGALEKRFTVKVDNGTLNFNIGTGPTDTVKVPFAANVTGNLKHEWTYPLSQVLGILKLSDTSSSAVMSFSDMGALKIQLDSGIGNYSYILPAGRA